MLGKDPEEQRGCRLALFAPSTNFTKAVGVAVHSVSKQMGHSAVRSSTRTVGCRHWSTSCALRHRGHQKMNPIEFHLYSLIFIIFHHIHQLFIHWYIKINWCSVHLFHLAWPIRASRGANKSLNPRVFFSASKLQLPAGSWFHIEDKTWWNLLVSIQEETTIHNVIQLYNVVYQHLPSCTTHQQLLASNSGQLTTLKILKPNFTLYSVIFMSTIITSPVLVRRGTKAAHGRLLYHWRQLTKAPWQREIFVSEMQQTNLSWETSKIAERLHLMLKTYCSTVTKILMESRGDRFTDHRSSRTAWQRQAIRRLQPWQTSMVQMFFNHGKTMENPNTNGILLK